MSRPPDAGARQIEAALWPAERSGEALFMLAECARLPVADGRVPVPPADLDTDTMGTWLEVAAERGGFHARPLLIPLADLGRCLGEAPPALVRLRAWPGEPFVALVGRRGSDVIALGPDRRRHRIPVQILNAAVRRHFEMPHGAAVDRVVAAMGLPAAKQVRAREALIGERLAAVRFRGCWSLGLPAGAGVVAHARAQGLPRLLALVTTAFVAQHALWLAAWWWLGGGVVSGTPGTAWVAGWIGLLAALVLFRVTGTWAHGRAIAALGRSVRRQLLHGALQMNPQAIRVEGVGRLFSVALEGATFDAMALNGGTQAAFGLLELLIAAAVLASADAGLAAMLGAWTSLAVLMAWWYASQRGRWTRERLQLTTYLLESMIGQRTVVAQPPPPRRHAEEDAQLAHYIRTGQLLDRLGACLATAVPRGWLCASLMLLALTAGPGMSTAVLALALAGILLGYRACRRLGAGLERTADAAITWRTMSRVLQAAPDAGKLGPDNAFATLPQDPGVPVVDVRDVTYRYPDRSHPVLAGCSLRIARGANILLEGPSGSGKTTFATVVAGLRAPAAGVVLVEGADHSLLHAEAWRRRVVLTPQAHDNYLVNASLAFNLLLGRRWPPLPEDFADAEMICRELGLGELLDRMPGGLNQTIGETGWQLSQGERMRVFIARAVLQRAGMVILDESFAALDPENLDRVLRCVQRRVPTLLAIAHP